MPPTTALPPARTSRRSLLRRGAAVGAASTVALSAGAPSAEATVSHRPARFRGAPLLSGADRHLVSRFSYGVTPTLTAEVLAAGGADRWFESQLSPGRIADVQADALVTWWPCLTLGPTKLWTNQRDGIEGGWEVMSSYQSWLLVRRITSKRQLAELMTEFWMNHLNVSVSHDSAFTHRFDYDRVVRANALGTYEDLLLGAITHPAMSMFLDNTYSTKDQPNENLGRELLELHTVGIGSYTEDDVKASARILTGYTVDMWDTFVAAYNPRIHWTGPVTVMGFSAANSDRDGRAVVQAYLKYLAHHPKTAERIARKLCVAFVSDTPSDALVARLAQVYLAHGTAIVPVLRALIATAEFKASAGTKVREPGADVVATYRALNVKLSKPPPGDSGYAAQAIVWQTEMIGQRPCAWPRPDGQPLDNEAWSSPSRLLASMEVHWSMSGQWWPQDGATYVPMAAWLPTPKIRFDLLVDHLCQQLLGRRSSATILRACLDVVPDDMAVAPATIITANHPLVRWGFYRLLSTMLDSPTHFTR